MHEVEKLKNEALEIIYGRKLAKLARAENKRMRKAMGYNTAEDRQFESPILKALQQMQEATVADLAHKLKMQQKQVQYQLYKLQKLELVKTENVKESGVPTIWVIK